MSVSGRVCVLEVGTRSRSWGSIAAGIAPFLMLMVLTSPARAVPSFATQTGLPCNACHVGGFGPQLTSLGRKFKMDGYGATSSWAVVEKRLFMRAAAMAVFNYAHTAADQSAPPADHFGTNDNVALQEASVFLAGRLAPGLGAFAQVTYSGIDRRLAWDNLDVRYARELSIHGMPSVLGVSVNNNPTIQDVWQTTPGWGFPYTSPDLAPVNNAAPLIAGGLAQQVMGVTPYLWLDNHLYLQAGAYRSLSTSVLNFLHTDVGPKIAGAAPYWRVAYSRDFGNQSLEVGGFGMNANLEPDRLPGAKDHLSDVGVDASYQLSRANGDVFSVNAAYIHERQRLDATFASGGSSNPTGHLNSYTVDASYYWRRHYGLTAGLFHTDGSTDPTLYAPAPDSGSRMGRPNTTGYRIQADFTPFGDMSSWAQPWVNMRLGLQYTGYTEFNGANHNYDGFGRKASDNNTLSAFLWTAF